ncbi:MAG: restriction endonuclease subunit S [Bacteroidota bacterium]
MKTRWGNICTLEYGKGLRNCPEAPSEMDRYRVYGTNGPIGWTSEPLSPGPGVIVGRKGAYRGIHFSREPFFVIDTAYYLRLKDSSVDMKWAYYNLLTVDINRIDVGAAIPTTNRDSFYAVPVVVPPLDKQSRIASILSAYDDLIDNNLRRIKLLEESAKQLYKEWFVRLRFPGYEHAKIRNGAPEGWQQLKAPDVMEINPRTLIRDGEIEITYVPMSSLSEGHMTVSFDLFEKRPKATGSKFKNGDVLFARITPCLENGKTAYVNFLSDGEVACGSTEFIVLRNKFLSPEFVYCLARTDEFRGNAIKSMIGSSGRQRVQESCFDEFKVPLPSRLIMDQFQEAVEPIFNKIRVLQFQSQRLRQARDILLPKLMSGAILR